MHQQHGDLPFLGQDIGYVPEREDPRVAGGPGGMGNFLEHFGPNIEDWWRDMRDVRLTPEVKATLMNGIEAECAGRSVETLAAERDGRLLDLLEMLRRDR